MIVARLGGALHFRVFDGLGQMIKDGDANDFRPSALRLADLERRLAPLWALREIPPLEKDHVIFAVNSILGLIKTKYFDLLEEVSRKIDAAQTELAVATALSKSLPPYRALLVLDSAAVMLEHANLEYANAERWAVRKEVDEAKARVVTLNDQLDDLKVLEGLELDELDELRRMAGIEKLADTEVQIIRLLKAYVSDRDANKPGPAAQSLGDATRLWRQEMERRFKSRVQSDEP